MTDVSGKAAGRTGAKPFGLPDSKSAVVSGHLNLQDILEQEIKPTILTGTVLGIRAQVLGSARGKHHEPFLQFRIILDFQRFQQTTSLCRRYGDLAAKIRMGVRPGHRHGRRGGHGRD
jgi:hypothetical protein